MKTKKQNGIDQKQSDNVTITVKGDSVLTFKIPNKFSVKSKSSWKDIKEKELSIVNLDPQSEW